MADLHGIFSERSPGDSKSIQLIANMYQSRSCLPLAEDLLAMQQHNRPRLHAQAFTDGSHLFGRLRFDIHLVKRQA